MLIRHLPRVAFCVVSLSLFATAQESSQHTLTVTPNNTEGIYAPGEVVEWKIERKSPQNDQPTSPIEVEYSVLSGGLKEIVKGTIQLSDQHVITVSRKDPGILLLRCIHKANDGTAVQTYGGAAFAPDQIKPSASAPEDFDEFWQNKISELRSVPMNVKLEEVDIGVPAIEYYKITMDNVQGKKIYGQLAKPRGGTDLPFALQVQWAGVYPLQRDWIRWQAESGWLALNISAHDLPIDEPDAFYQEKAQKELNDYPGQGNEDRQTSYFLPMFLSCVRAVDYLTEREDWNNQTMLVHGGSQGGYQAIVTAGLHPSVTHMAANVPAGCDHTGGQVERAPGWPQWASRTWQGKDADKMLQASRYFDAMNFASRSRATALVGIGLVDTACPAEGCIATFNALPKEKQMVLMPQADHSGDHQAYNEAFENFKQQIMKSIKHSEPASAR